MREKQALEGLDSRDLQLLDLALSHYRSLNLDQNGYKGGKNNEDRLWAIHEKVLNMTRTLQNPSIHGCSAPGCKGSQ